MQQQFPDQVIRAVQDLLPCPVAVPRVCHEMATQTSPGFCQASMVGLETAASPMRQYLPHKPKSTAGKSADRCLSETTEGPTVYSSVPEVLNERSEPHPTTRKAVAICSPAKIAPQLGSAQRRRLLPADPAAGSEHYASIYMQCCSSPSSSEGTAVTQDELDELDEEQHCMWY